MITRHACIRLGNDDCDAILATWQCRQEASTASSTARAPRANKRHACTGQLGEMFSPVQVQLVQLVNENKSKSNQAHTRSVFFM